MAEQSSNSMLYSCKNYKEIFEAYLEHINAQGSTERLLEEVILPAVNKTGKDEEWLAAEILGSYTTSGTGYTPSLIKKILDSDQSGLEKLNHLYVNQNQSPIRAGPKIEYYNLGGGSLEKAVEERITADVTEYILNPKCFKEFKHHLGNSIDVIHETSEFKTLLQLARNFESNIVSAYLLKRAFSIANPSLKSSFDCKALSENLKKVVLNRGIIYEDSTRSINLDDIGGYTSIKEDVQKEIINMFRALKNKTLKDSLDLEFPRGILLYGEPGTGKSMFLDAIINESKKVLGSDNVIAIRYNLAEDMDKYYGESEKRMNDKFDAIRKTAKKNSDKLYFISMDEGDTILERRTEETHEVTKRLINKMLDYMDGQNQLPANVVFLSATNKPELYDEAALRPGRFNRHIYVGPIVSKDDVKDILRIHLRKTALEEGLNADEVSDKIYSSLNYCVGADIAEIVRMAKVEELDQIIKTGKKPKLTSESIYKALNKFAFERSKEKRAPKKKSTDVSFA